MELAAQRHNGIPVGWAVGADKIDKYRWCPLDSDSVAMGLSALLAPLAFLALLFTLVVWYVRATSRPKHFPPGPDWLPVVGNLPTLKKLSRTTGGQHEALRHLSTVYNTDVVGLRLGGDLAICVVNHRLVRHVLTQEDFEGRPNNFFIRLRCLGVRRGITCVDGPLWHEQRAFVVRHLRHIGYGKKPMEAMVLDEVEQILQILHEQLVDNTPTTVQFEPLFAPSVLNVLWTLATGTRLSRDDPRLAHFLQILYTRSKAFDMAGGTLSQLPWLRHIAPERIGYNMLVRLNENLKSFFTQTIQEHHEAWYTDCQDDLIYAFITEMKKTNSQSFTDDQLIMICLDLFLAGSTTTSNTLDFIFLLMLLHPEIQEKAAHCVNSTVPSDEPVTYADRLKMPYVEAIIMESERMFPVAPVIGPRRVLRDITLDGYHIPQDTTVLINIHSVHYDKEYWGDPHVFRPDRFINNEGKLLPGDRVLNFGLGRRRCLGELLARQCIFLFFVAILRKYKICPVPGAPTPSTTPIPGLTHSPQKYQVILEPRKSSN